ncbi:MAG: AmmeMemoRadiSam system protein B [Deltaproteobacteria bacterium]|nr:AmmeMemoRadiSam system protein B [Deltaproteobacteria bacterium]
MQNVRPAAVAGLFYPNDPAVLTRAIEQYVGDARRGPSGKVKAIVAPHAGYAYSGPIAGSVFARLADQKATIRRVLLLGPAHRVYFRGVATPGVQAMRTPLGDVRTPAIAGAIAHPVAHADEHSLEVELPFLQHLFGPEVEVVPLLVGEADPQAVAKLLADNWGGDETLIVISSDLSHYLSYDDARASDRGTADQVLALDAHLTHDQACGATPLNALLLAAKAKRLTPALVDLRNSGDTAGDKRRVVGYAGFVFAEEPA